MTSSGLEWDYYEFQRVESSSVEYATPGADSFLLPANTDNSYWDPSAISEWSMSVHTAHTSEIVQEKGVPVKETKDEKNKRNQKRRARKEPRRSEREKEVSTLVPQPCAVPVLAVLNRHGPAPCAAWLAWLCIQFLPCLRPSKPNWETSPFQTKAKGFPSGSSSLRSRKLVSNGTIAQGS